MNKIILVTLVYCLSLTYNQSLSLAREESTCGAVYRDSLVYLKNYHGENADATTVGLFNGYVMASLDWYRYLVEKVTGEKPNISPMVNVGQVALIYARYLKNNPEKHDKNGMICFIRAMKEVFPQSN